ncbi:hypothetical protein [Streptomyces sp. H62]
MFGADGLERMVGFFATGPAGRQQRSADARPSLRAAFRRNP